jgi:hypothetical protein
MSDAERDIHEKKIDLLKYHLETIMHSDAADIESNDMDIYGEDAEGNDCGWSIEINKICKCSRIKFTHIKKVIKSK